MNVWDIIMIVCYSILYLFIAVGVLAVGFYCGGIVLGFACIMFFCWMLVFISYGVIWWRRSG